MKKAIIACVMATSAASAFAEWTFVSESEKTNFYIDKGSIRKNGGQRTVWQISDQKQRNNDGEMSTRTKMEYDCKRERVRTLSLSTHSESMAEGKVLLSLEADPKGWKSIPPETIYETIFQMVCAK